MINILWQLVLTGGSSVTAAVLIRSCANTHVTTCCSVRLLILGWKLPPRHTSSCRLRGWDVRWRVMLFIKQKALSGQLCHQCETMTHSSHFDTGPRSKPSSVLRNFIVGRVFYCLFYLTVLDKAAAGGVCSVQQRKSGRSVRASRPRACERPLTMTSLCPNQPMVRFSLNLRIMGAPRPPSPQRPSLLSPWTAAHTVTVGAAALRLVLDVLVLVCKKVRNITQSRAEAADITSCTTSDHIQVSW